MSKTIRQPPAASPQPSLSGRGQQAEAQRREREAAALRENLARRKAQQRLRRQAEGSGGTQTKE
jgi:hypothetical protein